MTNEATREWTMGYENPQYSPWEDGYLRTSGTWSSKDDMLSEGVITVVDWEGDVVSYLDSNGKRFYPMYRDCSSYVYAEDDDVADFPALHPTFAIGNALAESLGNSLVYCSKHLVGYPVGYPQPTASDGMASMVKSVNVESSDGFNQWQSDMQKHGEALINWDKKDSESDESEEDIRKAQEALRWVADNLVHLWD